MQWDKINGLLASPIFQTGMGLMQHRANNNYSVPQAVMGGMQGAQQQGQMQQEQQHMQAARQGISGLLGNVSPPGNIPAGAVGMPAGGALGGMPGGEPQGQSPGRIEQLYGLMAQVDPMSAGQNYANYSQRMQLQQQQDSPQEKFLRMYGNINPHDFTTQSIQDFHTHMQKTGQPDFSKLQRVNELTTKEQGFLNDALSAAGKAESDMGRMTNLANRFDELVGSGELKGKIAGGLNEWLKGALGSEDAVTQLRTEYEQLRISSVVQNLPPGVASDKDVELVLQGWNSSVADPAYLAAFLRGMRKMKAFDLAKAKHDAQYIGRNNGQTGLWESWEREREWRTQEALEFAGGFNPYEYQEAYARRYGASVPADGAPPAAPAAPAAQPTYNPNNSRYQRRQSRSNASQVKQNQQYNEEQYGESDDDFLKRIGG